MYFAVQTRRYTTLGRVDSTSLINFWNSISALCFLDYTFSVIKILCLNKINIIINSSSYYSSSKYRIRRCGPFPSELIWNYGSYRQLVGLLGRVISRVARPLPTEDIASIEETRTSIPWVGLEPTIPVFEPTKILGVLDRTAIMISTVDWKKQIPFSKR
jgi:hypothetical protein